jgi:hypothetical protein
MTIIWICHCNKSLVAFVILCSFEIPRRSNIETHNQLTLSEAFIFRKLAHEAYFALD